MLKKCVLLSLPLLLQSQQPAFKSGVALIAVDVHVVDRKGQPILNLNASDFEVHVSGKRRQVTSAQLVTYNAPQEKSLPSGSQPDRATDAAPRPRRMFVLAVDEHSLHAINAKAAVRAADRFIDKLQPDDLVAVYAYPTGIAEHSLTNDHASVRASLQKVAGLFDEPPGKFNLSPSEAIDIASGDRDVTSAVVRRECGQGKCNSNQILMEAVSLSNFIEMKVSQSVGGLRTLVRALGKIPGRKILVLVSGGLVSSDRAIGRANSGMEITQLGREAAISNVAIFALHLDWSFFEALSSRGGMRMSYFRDSNIAAAGLEMVAGTAGGTVMRVYGTSPDPAFDRVLRETSAHYLLGVEGSEADRDGRSHSIRVKVKRGGVQVRSRTEVVMPKR